MTADRKLWYELLAQADDAQARMYGLQAAAARVHPTNDAEARQAEELLFLERAARARGWAAGWREALETERRFSP